MKRGNKLDTLEAEEVYIFYDKYRLRELIAVSEFQ